MGGSNLMDKVFLLSKAQASNTSYFSGDSQREKLTTDYARAMGAFMSTYTDYYGNGYWWLRTPDTDYAYIVDEEGTIDQYSSVYNTFNSVVPALQIQL